MRSGGALLVVCTLAACYGDLGPVVRTDDGPIQGVIGKGLVEYHGVPFAEPPIGSLRWTYPRRPAPWQTPKQTVKRGPICPQIDLIKGEHLGHEDCLYLSVYVPDSCTTDSKCPVMHWIYGGAWMVGDNYEFGMYDGKHLSTTYGVIVVAANYRLDSLGWLALEELSQESGDGRYGNYGLADQRLALQWTQRNIGKFGGDPNQVTIFGESAGGFSVCQHLAAPASNRLFSRAIIESADCDGPFIILAGQDAKRFGDAYATDAGCPPTALAADRLACLRKLPLKSIELPYTSWFCPWTRKKDPWCDKTANSSLVQSALSLHKWPTPRPPMSPIAGWTAVVDGSEHGLPEAPLSRFERGLINLSPQGEPVAVTLGTNTDELALFIVAMPLTVPQVRLPITDGAVDSILRYLVQYHDGWNRSTADLISASYPKSKYRHAAARLTAIGTDLFMRCGLRRTARALASHGIATYLYQYDFKSEPYLDPTSEACELGSEHMRLDEPPEVGSGYAKVTCDMWDSLPRQTKYPH